MTLRYSLAACVLLTMTMSGAVPVLRAQEAAPSKLIQIADEPKFVDQALHVPKPLAELATVDFTGKSLKDVVTWLQETRKLSVVIDEPAFEEARILLSEPVTDRSTNEPVYLLLQRLRTLGIGWHYQDSTLHLSTIVANNEHQSTVNYNLGDLLDAGYSAESLVSDIKQGAGDLWEDQDGAGGTTVLLGDVLFVRHTDQQHREVAGLLAALRRHGRRTWTLDVPQHAKIRQKLDENITIEIQDKPLSVAVQTLATQMGLDIRLESRRLAEADIRERLPVSVKAVDQKLSAALRVMLSKLRLTWVIRDNVLWITTNPVDFTRAAVFDVRDLCRNDAESTALIAAIQTQNRGGWNSDATGVGQLLAPKPGILIVRHTESVCDAVLDLLENYRAALRNSKLRPSGVDPNEVITRFYRMPKVMAADISLQLPQLISAELWKAKQDQVLIQVTASKPEVSHITQGNAAAVVNIEPQSTLIVKQTRAVHAEIRKLIDRIERGDVDEEVQGGGFGGGGGGFGGGYYSVPAR